MLAHDFPAVPWDSVALQPYQCRRVITATTLSNSYEFCKTLHDGCICCDRIHSSFETKSASLHTSAFKKTHASTQRTAEKHSAASTLSVVHWLHCLHFGVLFIVELVTCVFAERVLGEFSSGCTFLCTAWT